MSIMNQKENVQEQYSDEQKLATRWKLHKLYSTNEKGLAPWTMEQIKFFGGCKVLELGCGMGGMWQGHIENLPEGTTLTLSDNSPRMVEIVREKYADFANVTFRQVDAQDIPYEDGTFDIVIANHMLYHMPDLPKAVAEIHRVLKSGGTFYATTNGTQGMSKYLHDALQTFNPKLDVFGESSTFTLQNGTHVLGEKFPSVRIIEFEDALIITNTQDLIDWILSTITITGLDPADLAGLDAFFEEIRNRDGAIHIPKQAGMFVCVK